MDLHNNHRFKIHFPNSPTYYPKRSNARLSILDIALSNNQYSIINVKTINDLCSDHVQVMLDLNCRVEAMPPITKFIHKEANFRRFTQYLEKNIVISSNTLNQIKNKQNIDDEIQKITEIILKAQEFSLPKRRVKMEFPYALPVEIKTFIREKNYWRRVWQRTRNEEAISVFKGLTKEVNYKIREFRNKKME